MTEMPSQATWCSPDSTEFREVFKDNSIHKMKVIFWALISSSPLISKYHLAHSVLSALFISKINTSFFFSGQIGVLYSSWFARSPPHLRNVKDLKARIKGTFLINIFFSLSASFFLKAVFHYL